MTLLRRPAAAAGLVHDITPAGAGWTYVGFALWRLAPGETAAGRLDGREGILVLVEGHAGITAAGQDFGRLGDRLSVFEKSLPHAVYAPPGSAWSATAATPAVLALCTAPAPAGAARPAARIGPQGIAPVSRGKGGNARLVHPVAMEERDVAARLLVTEVFTPEGHWSSYPPHRHDEDDFPRMTYLEETYYHRLNPATGYGHQRVFTDDLALDETMTVRDHDVVLVPRGHHPCGVPWGVEMYYLNVMAGPRRAWRFATHPDWRWLVARDA
jgi:5-deoxy-glucuronate isomerase